MPAQLAIVSPTPALSGLGLFSGRPARLTIRPPEPGVRGICLRRTDRTAPRTVHCDISLVAPDAAWAGLPPALGVRNTALLVPGPEAPRERVIATVEHVLAALTGLHIWHALVEVDGPEVPMLDGSALPFARIARDHAGPATHQLEPIRLRRPLEVRRNEATILAEPLAPGDTPEFVYQLEYPDGSGLPPQAATWRHDANVFARDIAPARTFSLEAEARAAHAAGLFNHVSPRDMLVISPQGEPIDNAWRCEQEPARHKLLDLIGDLALLGRPLHARVTAARSGHALTHQLCRELSRHAEL